MLSFPRLFLCTKINPSCRMPTGRVCFYFVFAAYALTELSFFASWDFFLAAAFL